MESLFVTCLSIWGLSCYSSRILQSHLWKLVEFQEVLYSSHLNISRSIDCIAGAYAGFLRGGGPNFKISGILDIHAAKRHVASSECASLCEGGLGAWPPKKIFKNGAISCVLRAIFNHFQCKKILSKNYKLT